MFNPIGFVLGLGIPILSAVAIFPVSGKVGISSSIGIVVLGFALHGRELKFDIHVSKVGTGDERAFFAMIRDMDFTLSATGKETAEARIPKSTAENRRRYAPGI